MENKEFNKEFNKLDELRKKLHDSIEEIVAFADTCKNYKLKKNVIDFINNDYMIQHYLKQKKQESNGK